MRYLAISMLFACALLTASAQEDAYESYVKNSIDFASVDLDRDGALKAWPGWYYMPWPFRWAIGYDNDAGKWCLEHGYNGAHLDQGETEAAGTDKLAWIEKFGLRFYGGHVAGKGDLFLWDRDEVGPHRPKLWGTGVRPRPLDSDLKAGLEKRIGERITRLKTSPMRAAYALDDEPSWGYLVAPCMWRLSEDPDAFATWLESVYGSAGAPEREEWITYDAIQPRLARWAIRDFDCSRLMDQWSYNDSCWSNFIGGLVRHGNTIDPETPCGLVGCQNPSPFGGYDYAKLMKKIQFIEAYDLGGSQAIIRSFNRGNVMPVVTTHFRRFDPADPLEVTHTIWQVWYYLAHGNAGMIGWVDGWFDEETKEPHKWHDLAGRHYLEAGKKIGPLVRGATWLHDGVAIYYSHASIQLGWILDAEAHGRTWRNRNDDHRLGASHLVRHAWENMLRDEGLQYDFVSYADVIREGVPEEYRVLILPATLCLSDVEARRIEAFCKRGGTVIADYMPGLFDEHGRGRDAGGALDHLFGVRHDPGLHADDVFQKKRWTEVDQEAHYDYASFETFLTKENTCLFGESGFHKAVREMETVHVKDVGAGRAVLMNLSPQMYNAFRVLGPGEARNRETFMKHVKAAGPKRWVRIENADARTHGYEITYWKKDGRTLLFLCYNPGWAGLSTGKELNEELKRMTVRFRMKFDFPLKNARDERSGASIPVIDRFEILWKMDEAIVLSFEGEPP
jgi:hypothetical protein